MRKLNIISVVIVLGISINSCTNLEANYCSKDCNTNLSIPIVAQENDHTKILKLKKVINDSILVDFNSVEPLVCMLTGVEQATRKKELQKEVLSKVKKVEEIETGFIFYFAYEEKFLIKMTDYVIAENNCCPFLTFEIKLHAKEDVVLKITGTSQQVKVMIKMALIDTN